MQLSVQIEKPSKILRKLIIKVPALTVQERLEKGWVDIQKTAKIKGFRPGQVPLSLVKQYYGEDVRHRVFHRLVDESFERAIQEQNLRTIGSPRIEVPTGLDKKDDAKSSEEDDHSHHTLREGEDLTYTATIEIMPEIVLKDYSRISLIRRKIEVTDEDVEKAIRGFLNSHAELLPASGGLVMADGSLSSRPARHGDVVEISFQGKIKKDAGFETRDDLSGSRLVEIGSGDLIPGFEDQLLDMKSGDSKTFQIAFPKDFSEPELAGLAAEFLVTVNELKEKRLPDLNDEFLKPMGYENVQDFREKLRSSLFLERTEERDRLLRSDLLKNLIETHEFDVPVALVRAQMQVLIEAFVDQLKKNGAKDSDIEPAVQKGIENFLKRAEIQVRVTLILKAISEKEKIEVQPEEVQAMIRKLSAAMKVEELKLNEYYSKRPESLEQLSFQLLEDKVVSFLLSQAKIQN